MSIFKTIADAIKSVVHGKKPDSVEKTAILNLIDDNKMALDVVISTYEENPDLFKYIQRDVLTAKGPTQIDRSLYAMYETYVKSLNPIGRRQEVGGLFASIYTAAKFCRTDMQQMGIQFDSLFSDGTNVGDIDADQMKISHAALFGYINLTAILCDWFCFMFGSLSGQAHENNPRVPAYRLQFIKTASKDVAEFVSDVLTRGNNGILTVIRTIKDQGDVALYTEKATLDTYADIDNYPGVSHLFEAFNPWVWVLWSREKFTTLQYNRNQRKIMNRDWMAAKVIALRMDMQRMSPEDPAYTKQQEIIQRYDDRITGLDKQILTYEKVA